MRSRRTLHIGFLCFYVAINADPAVHHLAVIDVSQNLEQVTLLPPLPDQLDTRIIDSVFFASS